MEEATRKKVYDTAKPSSKIIDLRKQEKVFFAVKDYDNAEFTR